MPIPKSSPKAAIMSLANKVRNRTKTESQEDRDKRIEDAKERLITTDFGTAYANIEKKPGKLRPEDRFAIGRNVVAVCDGVSTADLPSEVGAQNVAEMMVEVFDDQFQQELEQQQDQQAFVEEQALTFLQQASEVAHQRQTTISGAVLWRDRSGAQNATIAHAGDSKIYLLHNGEFQSLTVDESYARVMTDAAATAKTEAERKQLVEAANNPRMAQIITNSLGGKNASFTIRDDGRGNVHTVRIPEGATLVFASDGLEKAHPSPVADPEGFHLGEQVERIAREAEEQHTQQGGSEESAPKAIGDALYQDATAKGLKDDYNTVVLKTNAAKPQEQQDATDTTPDETISFPAFNELQAEQQRQKEQLLEERAKQVHQQQRIFETAYDMLKERRGPKKAEALSQRRIQEIVQKNNILAPRSEQSALTAKILDDVFSAELKKLEQDSDEAINLVLKRSHIEDRIQEDLAGTTTESYAHSLLAAENELRILQAKPNKTTKDQEVLIQLEGIRNAYRNNLLTHYESST